MTDEYCMRMCLRLATRGRGWTNPNPMVGAILVKNGKIIGKGYHHRFGSPHAEVEAIRGTEESATNATLYVNLEPCCHVGKTPPCANTMIAAGISRVVCAVQDPNPLVSGKGITRLRQAGIDVRVGLLETEARILNEAFFTFYEKKRPYVAIKFAAGLDGSIATKTGDSKWITGEKARAFARSLRAQYQAVLVGINTILSDDPHLGVHLRGKRDPLRIILDSRLRIPLKAHVLRDGNALVVTTNRARKESVRRLSASGVSILQLGASVISIPLLLDDLSQRQIVSMLVEGGGEVLGSFADAKLIDKVYAFHAPLLIGGRGAVSAVGGEGRATVAEAVRLSRIRHRYFDDTLLTIGYPV